MSAPFMLERTMGRDTNTILLRADEVIE